MEGSVELFAPIAANPIIHALTEKGVRTEPTLRFTQAACHGAIHPALNGFPDSELRAIQEPLEFWQFPKSWSLAIAEELAYRHYQSTGELLEPILTPVQRIMDYVASITGAERDIETVFSSSKVSAIDTFLGRRKIGKQFLTYKELSFATTNAVRYLMTDLMELMIDGIRSTSLTVGGTAVYDGNLEGVRWLAERELLSNVPIYTLIACQNQSLPILKLLLEHGVPMDTVECWKAALGHKTPDIPLLDYLYDVAPEWTTTGIEPHINSPILFNWAFSKGIPLEFRVIFINTKSIPVINTLLDNGYLPTSVDITAACKNFNAELLTLLLKRKIPLAIEPVKLVWDCLKGGAIGGVVRMLRYEMVFDRAALWTPDRPDIPLSIVAINNVLRQLREFDCRQIVIPIDITNGKFIVSDKEYPCKMTSDLLAIADAIVLIQNE